MVVPVLIVWTGTETFYFNSEGGLREHLSIYHNPATHEVSGDDIDDSKDEEIKASILLVIFAPYLPMEQC